MDEVDLIYTVSVANLAALYSRVWSYGWRIGHLAKAVGYGKAAIKGEMAEQHQGPENETKRDWFTRKFQGQLDTVAIAAITVLVQSMFDGALNELLATCVQNDGASWQERILREWKREYSLAETLTLDRVAVMERATNHYLRYLTHKAFRLSTHY